MFYNLGILLMVQELLEVKVLGEVFDPQWDHPP